MTDEIEQYGSLGYWRRRAAEALEGPEGTYNDADRAHRVAVLLLAGDTVLHGGEPDPVAILIAETGYPAPFVKKVLQRFDAASVWPLGYAYECLELPGPDFDIIRDVQVGLGLAFREDDDSRSRPRYELTDTARVNIARLRRLHSAPREIDAVDTLTGSRSWYDAALVVEGSLRRRRGTRSAKVRPGSMLILSPASKRDLPRGAYVSFAVDSMTAWLKVERRFDNPRRFEARLLGVSGDGMSGEDALEELRDLLCGGVVRSKGTEVPLPLPETHPAIN